MPGRDTLEIVASLANRGAARTEATVQAEVRGLLFMAPLGLDADQVVALPSAQVRRWCGR